MTDKESIESILDWHDRPRRRCLTVGEALQEESLFTGFDIPGVLCTRIGQFDSVDLTQLRLVSLYGTMFPAIGSKKPRE